VRVWVELEVDVDSLPTALMAVLHAMGEEAPSLGIHQVSAREAD
jgi:hypothetical protein